MNTQVQAVPNTVESLPVIFWQDKPVITTELLSSVYDVQEKQIRQNFANNADRFNEGIHYFKLQGADLKEFSLQVEKIDSQISNKTRSLMLWTERGTVRHAKMLGTDKAWEVQDQLEDFYFTKNQSSSNPCQLPEPKTKKALPGGLTLEQQDTIKALVKQRAEELPKEKQAGAIIKQWSAIKKKFGCSYKEVAPENFVNIISLITRLPIEGELMPKAESTINNDLIEILTGRIKALEGELMPKEVEQMPKLTGKCFIKTKIHLDADHLAEMMQEQGLMLVDAKEYAVVRRPEAGKAH